MDPGGGDRGGVSAAPERWVGRSLPRLEDAALHAGRGRFIDDPGVPSGTLHAAILRSPHAHAEIVAIETTRAAALSGVAAVLTGATARALSAPPAVGLRVPIES